MGSNSKGSVRNSSKNFGVAGDFIPLSGTTVDNPITGDMQVIDGIAIKCANSDANEFNKLFLGEAVVGMSINNGVDFITFQVESEGVNINSSNLSLRGIYSIIDFSANITDLDYTQKIYVDSNFVAKGVENNTTVVLSSATLDSTYPDATTGFRVYCASIIVGAMTYETTPT